MNAGIAPHAGEQGPHYVYDGQAIERSIAALRCALPDFGLLYSMKANPFRPLLELMRSQGLGIDAASAGEVQAALAAGFAPADIFYSSPGKTGGDLAFALDRAVLVADALGELARIESLAASLGRTVRIGLRVNPATSLGPEPGADLAPQGAPSKFGIDEEMLLSRLVEVKRLRLVEVDGIHVYLRSQVCCARALCALASRCVQTALALGQGLERRLSWVNVGGGFGTASALDLQALRQGMAGLGARLPRARLFAESGRYLVARAGTFVTPIVDIKISRGVRCYIAGGTLDCMLRPGLARLLARLDGGAPAWPIEPLYSSPDCHRVRLVKAGGEEVSGPAQTVTVAGPFCTALDVLAEDIQLPRAEIGDWIAVSSAGAYCASLSPAGFASRPGAREYLV